MNELDQIALFYKTDKASSHHNYTRIYSHIFKDRDTPINLVEIGVDKGYSLCMWRDWFKNGSIYGIDIRDVPISEPRISVFKGDAASQNFVDLFLTGTNLAYNIDVLIDDGSHMVYDQIRSFFLFWPSINSGGIYVIEDTHTNYGPNATLNFSYKLTDWLRHLMDEVNWHGKWNSNAQGDTTLALTNAPLKFDYGPVATGEELSFLSRTIDSISIYKSLVIFKKR